MSEEMNFNFDPDKLTLGQGIEIEEISGVPLSEMANGSLKVMAAIAFVMGKADNPALTYDEVLTWELNAIGEALSDVSEDESDPVGND